MSMPSMASRSTWTSCTTALRSCRRPDGLKYLVEGLGQGDVEVGHGHRQAEIDQRGDAVLADAARHEAGIVAEIGLEVDRQPVERHPMADAHADGGDLVLAPRSGHPDADPARPALGGDVEAGQRTDGPVLEVGHEAADVLPALPEVEHHIDHALARAV